MSELSMAETIAHVLMLGASERRTGQQAEECDEGSLIKGPFIKDVGKIFGILDPLPPLSAFWLDLQE